MFSEKDLIRLSWAQYESLVEKLQKEIQGFLDKNHTQVDLIVPVFRSGAFPALSLSFKLNSLRFLPMQFKYFNEKEKGVERKLLEPTRESLLNFNKTKPTILIAEGNQVTGNFARQAFEETKKLFPESTIIYAALATDYSYRSAVKADFSCYGIFSNESKKLSKEECKKLGVVFDKVYVFPWQTTKEELAACNEESFTWNY